MHAHSTILLIPAFQPGPELAALVKDVMLLNSGGVVGAVVVVDDGSGAAYSEIFAQTAALDRTTVLRHAVNLGKGAALKTGFNHCLLTWPDSCGVVTADADGQHDPADILTVARRLAQRPRSLILGVRRFPSHVPWRSRIGNILTRLVFMILTGRRLLDTQTGLRGWPAGLCRDSLRIPIQGYDFELEALVRARAGQIEELPIRTIYLDGNRGSHFNPLRDSLRIYFVFVRYCGSALLAATVDTLVFSLAFARSGDLALSQAAGRVVAVCVTFVVLRSMVFRSDAAAWFTFARYAGLVALSGWLSFGLIGLFRDRAHLPVLAGKLLAESLLFLGNFAFQREFIFTRRRQTGL